MKVNKVKESYGEIYEVIDNNGNRVGITLCSEIERVVEALNNQLSIIKLGQATCPDVKETDENLSPAVKQCTCSSYQLYNFGCKCGAIKPYQPKY